MFPVVGYSKQCCEKTTNKQNKMNQKQKPRRPLVCASYSTFVSLQDEIEEVEFGATGSVCFLW